MGSLLFAYVVRWQIRCPHKAISAVAVSPVVVTRGFLLFTSSWLAASNFLPILCVYTALDSSPCETEALHTIFVVLMITKISIAIILNAVCLTFQYIF